MTEVYAIEIAMSAIGRVSNSSQSGPGQRWGTSHAAFSVGSRFGALHSVFSAWSPNPTFITAGRGSSFVVAVTEREHHGSCEESPRTTKPEDMPAVVEQRSLNVLWIDDELLQDSAAILLLELQRIHVTCATTAQEGLRLANSKEFDAILLDLRLPDFSGLLVLEILREAGNEAPVIVCTGFGGVGEAVRTMKLGAADFVTKPVIATALAARIRTIVKGFSGSGTGRALETLDPQDNGLVPLLRRLLRTDQSQLEFVHAAIDFRRALQCSQAPPMAERRPEIASELPRILQSAVLMLEDTLARGVMMSEEVLAAQAGMDRIELAKLFQRHFQAGFRAVRRFLRLRSALEPLRSTDEQVSQIAYQTGYEYEGQFSRDFTLSFGMSPGRFRRMARALLR